MKSLKLYDKDVVSFQKRLLQELRKQFGLRIQLKLGKLKRFHMLKIIRRNISVIKNSLSSRK